MTEDEMDGWHHWLSGRESERALGDREGQRSLVLLQSMGSQRVWHNWATEQQQQRDQTHTMKQWKRKKEKCLRTTSSTYTVQYFPKKMGKCDFDSVHTPCPKMLHDCVVSFFFLILLSKCNLKWKIRLNKIDRLVLALTCNELRSLSLLLWI